MPLIRDIRPGLRVLFTVSLFCNLSGLQQMCKIPASLIRINIDRDSGMGVDADPVLFHNVNALLLQTNRFPGRKLEFTKVVPQE